MFLALYRMAIRRTLSISCSTRKARIGSVCLTTTLISRLCHVLSSIRSSDSGS